MSEVINGSSEVLKNALELNSDLVWVVKENMDVGRFQDAVAYLEELTTNLEYLSKEIVDSKPK